jgi:hypothetical protein
VEEDPSAADENWKRKRRRAFNKLMIWKIKWINSGMPLNLWPSKNGKSKLKNARMKVKNSFLKWPSTWFNLAEKKAVWGKEKLE